MRAPVCSTLHTPPLDVVLQLVLPLHCMRSPQDLPTCKPVAHMG